MHISSIKTKKVVKDDNLFIILDRYLKDFSENSIIAITSKVISICEGSLVKIDSEEKKELIEKQADRFISGEENQYGTMLTITNDILIAAAGIDESNGNGYSVLWPKNPQRSANTIRHYLQKKFSLKNVGVVITDSRTSPLRWGTTGIALSHSGFRAVNSYIGKKDLFGKTLHITKVNIIDSLADAAVVVMGESTEQTPIAIITDIPFVKFQKTNPSKKQMQVFHQDITQDLYAPILTKANWQKGKK